MKKSIIMFILFSLLINSVGASIENNYYLELKYDNGEIILKSLQIGLSKDGRDNIPGGYIAEIIDFEKKRLNVIFFDIPLKIVYDTFDEDTEEANDGGMIELNQTEFNLRLPYYESAKEIDIYDKNLNKKLTIDVSPYAKRIHQKIEEKPKIGPKKQEPVEKIPATEKKPINYTMFIIFGIITLIVFFIIIIRIVHSRKTNY